MKLIVDCIYPSFMGEVNKFGIGALCTFVRLHGCNIRCYKKTFGFFCDTPEALDAKRYAPEKVKTVSEIVDEVAKLGNRIVCLTGGEPLLQSNTSLLVDVLSADGYHVVIETNGTAGITKYCGIKNVSFVVDYKLPSTGEEGKMDTTIWPLMGENDYLKFVVSDSKDYLHVCKWLELHSNFKGNVAIGSMWEHSSVPQVKLVDAIRTLAERFPEIKFCMNMQTHKLITLYDKVAPKVLRDLKIDKRL